MNYELRIKKNFGFTLFELLVSISIIAIMVAVASMSYSTASKKARDSRRIEDISAIQKAAEQYYSQNNYVYPSTIGAFVTGGVMQLWPADPKGVGWTAYAYNIATTYCVCAAVENASLGNSSANNCTFAASGIYFCAKSQQ
jgi:prepilin-type N-terminal cleavage/methylation domain-containing protein